MIVDGVDSVCGEEERGEAEERRGSVTILLLQQNFERLRLNAEDNLVRWKGHSLYKESNVAQLL